MKTEYEINDPVAEEWLDSQKKTTRTNYKGIWVKFAAYVKMTGKEVLAARKDDKECFWEKRVLAFKTFMKDSGFADYTATTAVMAIRGFFAYYRTPLVYRRGESKRLRERTRKTEDYRFSLDGLRKMYDVADLTERYVITAGKSFGLRAGDFMRLTRGDLEPHIDKETPISIGEYKTEKEGVYAFPFIDSDAKPVIKLMLERMTRAGRTENKQRVLTYEDGIQLTRVLKRCVDKAGINTGGKQVRFHCLRKFLADHLSSVMSESKWKQIVGKMISEGAYISPDSLRADYERAMTEITFTRNILQEERVRELAREELKATLTPEQRELMAKSGLKLRKKENVSAPKDECGDGKHCGEGEDDFKQIAETQLLSYLKEGYEIQYKLASGELIVKRT